MDNVFNCKRLFYSNEVFYYFKDVLRNLKYVQDQQSYYAYLNLLNENEQFNINELESKFKNTGFRSYIREDHNKTVIQSLLEPGPHVFINQNGLKKILPASVKSIYDNILNTFKEMNLEGEFEKERPDIFSCLLKIFKYENYKIQHIIKGYIVDIYFIDYNLAIKRTSSYIKNKKRLEKSIGCSIIIFNPCASNFNLFDFIEEVAKFMENYNIEKFNNCYYYLQN